MLGISGYTSILVAQGKPFYIGHFQAHHILTICPLALNYVPVSSLFELTDLKQKAWLLPPHQLSLLMLSLRGNDDE